MAMIEGFVAEDSPNERTLSVIKEFLEEKKYKTKKIGNALNLTTILQVFVYTHSCVATVEMYFDQKDQLYARFAKLEDMTNGTMANSGQGFALEISDPDFFDNLLGFMQNPYNLL